MIALPRAVAEEGVEIGMANAVALGLDLRQIDAEIARTGADGGGCENGFLIPLPSRGERYSSRSGSGFGAPSPPPPLHGRGFFGFLRHRYLFRPGSFRLAPFLPCFLGRCFPNLTIIL